MKNIYLINADFGGGGTGTTAYHAVRGLRRHGLVDKVLARDSSNIEWPLSDKIVHPVPLRSFLGKCLNGVNQFLCSSFSGQSYSDRMFDFYCLKHIDKDIKILHTWNTPLRCVKKAKKQGAIIIRECASSHPLTQRGILQSEYSNYGLKYKYSKRQLDRALKEIELADYLFVPSQFVYDSYKNYRIFEKKLILIPFGVDIHKFSPPKSKKQGTFRALFVGQISLRKGIAYLLKAWDELGLPDSELVLCGRVHPDCKQLIEKYKLKMNLVLTGHCNPVPHYQNADVFIFPSLEEGSALVTYEAMACGLPVITTEETGSVIVSGADGFIIPSRNCDAIKEKVKYLYDTPTAIKMLGFKARTNIEKYTWNNYGEAVAEAYRRIINENSN